MNIEQRKLRKIDDEIWRTVPNCNECYQVSNYGRIKSFVFNKKDGQIVNGSYINGFKHVTLNMRETGQRIYVHKLVAEVWIPKPSEQHIYVTHLDGNMKNNHVSNLEWHTHNTLIEKHREFVKSSQHPKTISNSKLKESDIGLLKSMLERGVVQSKISKMFCISEMQVTRIKRGENWGHVQPQKTEKPETISETASTL
ncbi:MAG: NUMOD4 domain-containing protein [Salinivirgaceae bacterium]